MSDRTENRKTDRDPTEAPGARHDAPEEYTAYREVDPDEAGTEEAEALREAELQPGTPASERGAEPGNGPDERQEKNSGTRSE